MHSFFRKKKLVKRNPDTDPIAITHTIDPSLDDDEMILHTTIEPESIKKESK